MGNKVGMLSSFATVIQPVLTGPGTGQLGKRTGDTHTVEEEIELSLHRYLMETHRKSRQSTLDKKEY